jgi:hypothetical protein
MSLFFFGQIQNQESEEAVAGSEGAFFKAW